MLTFLTGFIASVAHVATGPDHLAAVTPLAIDSRKKSWMIGFSWGLGHTVGMLLIGALFLVFKKFLPVEALVRLYRRHTHGYKPHAHFHTKPFLYPHIHKHTHPVPLVFEHPVDPLHQDHLHEHSPDHTSHHDRPDHHPDHDHHQHEHHEPHDHPHPHGHSHDHYSDYQEARVRQHPGDANTVHHHEHIPDYGHGHVHVGKVKQNAFSAFLIGTVHGFAGFSHLFALLPSLALPTLLASVIYIVAFATGTILTMITFAFILGIVAHRSEMKDNQLFLKWFSLIGALLAIAIGILWIFHPIG